MCIFRDAILPLRGGSWVFINGVITRLATAKNHMRGRIAPLIINNIGALIIRIGFWAPL